MANFVADGVSMTGREIRTLNGEFGGGNGLSLEVDQGAAGHHERLQGRDRSDRRRHDQHRHQERHQRFEGTVYGFFRPTSLGGGQPAYRRARRRRSGSSTAGASAVRSCGTARTSSPTRGHRRIDDASVVTSVLDPGASSPQPQHAAPGLRPSRPPLQHQQRARRALQPHPQRQENAGRRRAEHVRSPHEQRVADRHLRHLARQHHRLEQGQRGALPLHLRHRGLLFAADRRQRRGVADAGLHATRPVTVSLHGRRQSRHQSGLPAEPRREARRSGSITSRSCAAPTSASSAAT